MNNKNSNDLGGWKSTIGAAINVLSRDGTEYGSDPGQIYGNGLHQTILQLVIELGDANGAAVIDDFPTVDALQRSVQFCNYYDRHGYTEFGSGESAGWTAAKDVNCFLSPLQDSDADPIAIAPDLYKDVIDTDAGIAYLYYFVSYDGKDFTSEVSCNIGVSIQPKDEHGITHGTKYLLSDSSQEGDPAAVAALPAITFTPDDFFWTGTHIEHDGENDDFAVGAPAAGNFWRQIAYTVKLKENGEYTTQNRHGSKLFRCRLEDYGFYSSSTTDEKKKYYFGIQNNGPYSFTGYLWPYNLYEKDQATAVSGQPIVPSPAANSSPVGNKFKMGADGMAPSDHPTVAYAQYQLNLTLFCSFGWTANDAYDFNPLYVTVYDQYGNSGLVVIDPVPSEDGSLVGLPLEYTDPNAEGGLCQRKYFRVENSQAPANPDENARHVYFKLVLSEDANDPEHHLYLSENVQQEDTVVCISGSSGYPPEAQDMNLFRLYRNPRGGSGATTNSLLTYNIINIEYTTITLTPEDSSIGTMSVKDGDTGWQMVLIWCDNSFALFRTGNAYMGVDYTSSFPKLCLLRYPTSKLNLVWKIVIDTDHTGEPDKGQGYDDGPYRVPGTNGRNYWVTMTNVQMTLGAPGGVEVGYIFPNGRNQAKITVTITPTDADQKPLSREQMPTLDYVKSCVSAIDYYSLVSLEKDPQNPGWAYSLEENTFNHHTFSSGEEAVIDWDSLKISEPDDQPASTMTFDIYVTYSLDRGDQKKFVGLMFKIYDERWGDPIIYTCSNAPTSGGALNFNQYVEIRSNPQLIYNKDNVKCIPVNLSSANIDDTWPLNLKGMEPDSNIWRFWHYEVTLSSPVNAALAYCATDYDFQKYDLENGVRFANRYDGLYKSEAIFWPTNIVDLKFNPIPLSDVRNFKFNGGHGININNNNSKSLYLSVFYEFGKRYKYTIYNTYINMKLYDQYGNVGDFHIDVGCIPSVYNKDSMGSLNLLSDGFVNSNGINKVDDPVYNILTLDETAGAFNAITISGYSASNVTWDGDVAQLDGNRSVFRLDGDIDTNGYLTWYCFVPPYRPSNSTEYEYFNLGHKFSDNYNKIFAGVDLSPRFHFYFSPVWEDGAFLMCTQYDEGPDNVDSGKSFAYINNVSNGKCRLSPTPALPDVGFKWIARKSKST